MENLNDIQLVDLYLRGNQKAFDGLVNRHSQSTFRFIIQIVDSTDEANDIVQETFIKVWKNIHKFDQRKNLKTWIFTIAKRTAIDYLRKVKSVSFSSIDNTETETSFGNNIPDEGLMANEIFEENENIELIRNALKTVSLENKSIILLHHGEEMTFEEISDVLEKPMNTIKSQYRRTLIALRKFIISQTSSQIAPKAQ
jgi:RNA polymerase sigma-70 factor (ECF subfamily)